MSCGKFCRGSYGDVSVCTYSCLRPFKPAHMPIGWSGRSDDNQFTQPRRLRRRRHPTITPKIYSDEQNHIFICCSITFLCLPYLLNTWSVKVWWLNFDQSRKTLELFSCTSMKKVDAGGQCGYPNFCPTFVLCLAFVQHMSSLCPHFVLVKHLSNKCPKCPTFVPSKSIMCPNSQTFLLHLSSWLGQNSPENWKTKLGHKLDMIIFPFGIWSHCTDRLRECDYDPMGHV